MFIFTTLYHLFGVKSKLFIETCMGGLRVISYIKLSFLKKIFFLPKTPKYKIFWALVGFEGFLFSNVIRCSTLTAIVTLGVYHFLLSL